jgi:hypothetical protein
VAQTRWEQNKMRGEPNGKYRRTKTEKTRWGKCSFIACCPRNANRNHKEGADMRNLIVPPHFAERCVWFERKHQKILTQNG